MSNLHLLGVVPAWHDKANCDGLGDVMFPERGDHATAAWAKRLCNRCDVRTECLDDALSNREQHGIRGGLTPNERKELAKDRAAGKAPVAA